MTRPALFLDRDGVINVDHGYVCTPERTDFIDGVFELVRTANQRGYAVVVVTNQAGIARGYYSEEEFLAYMDWVRAEFARRDARIDAVYYCPHHPTAGQGKYLKACDCRKPAPGMIMKAIRELDIEPSTSFIVGDRHSDLEAGARAGVSHGYILGEAGINKINTAREIIFGLGPEF